MPNCIIIPRRTHEAYIRGSIANMEVPITQFRRDIFELANRALDGETITVAYKGKRLTLVPEAQLGSRWEKKTDLKIIHPDHPNLDDDDLKAEMQADWEKDWAEL